MKARLIVFALLLGLVACSSPTTRVTRWGFGFGPPSPPPGGGIGGVSSGDTWGSLLSNPGGNSSDGNDVILSTGDKLIVPLSQVFVHRSGGSVSRGLAMDDNGTWQTDGSGTRTLRLNQSGFLDLGVNGGIRFAVGPDPDGSKDLGIIHSGTGTVGITADSTANPAPGDLVAGNLTLQGDGASDPPTAQLDLGYARMVLASNSSASFPRVSFRRTSDGEIAQANANAFNLVASADGTFQSRATSDGLEIKSTGRVGFHSVGDASNANNIDVAIIRSGTNTIGIIDQNLPTGNPSPGNLIAGDLTLQGDGLTTNGGLTISDPESTSTALRLTHGGITSRELSVEGSDGILGRVSANVYVSRATPAGAKNAQISPAGLDLNVTGALNWRDNANLDAGAEDLGIERGGVGELRVTDASTGGARRVTAGNANTPLQYDGFTSGRAQEGRVEPSSSGNDLSGSGLLATITESDQTSSLQVTSGGNAFRQNTNTPLGSEAGWEVGTDLIHFSAKPWLMLEFAPGGTTDQRTFVGISDQTLSTMISADDPAGNYVGLQLRAADTNFFVVYKDGTTLTRVDTGIVATTGRCFVEIDVRSPTDVQVTVKSPDGSSFFTTTITTGLPGASTLHEPIIGTENTTAGTLRSIDTYSAKLVLRS